jgi:YHS domain-containing protein
MLTSGRNKNGSHEKTIDPVCGITIDADKKKLVSIHRGYKYYFCSEGCRKSFEADPERYLNPYILFPDIIYLNTFICQGIKIMNTIMYSVLLF